MYIITLLIFYAPSKKCMNVDNSSEEIEFSRLTDCLNEDEDNVTRLTDKTDAQLLKEFTSKQNLD